MRARAEGAAWIDDDCERVLRRRFPGRPQPERPDAHRPVELSPTVFPAGFDVRARRVRKGGPHALCRLAVRRELDLTFALDLLEAVGSELHEQCAQLLRAAGRNADRGADQRNALLSLSKKPSSGL